MTNPDLVSIVVTVFNKGEFLAQCLDSALSQSHTQLELIVVDDGSTDNSSQIIEKIIDPRVRKVHQKNAGVCHARNSGLEMARGEWVLFLDGDDWLDRLHLEKLLEPSEEGVDLVVSTWWEVTGEESSHRRIHHSRDLSETSLLSGSPWVLHAAMLRRRLLLDNGIRFSIDLSRLSCEDNRFWFETCRLVTPAFVDFSGAYYRINVADSRTHKEDCGAWVRGFIKSVQLNLGDIPEPIPNHYEVILGSIENVCQDRGARLDSDTASALNELYSECLEQYFDKKPQKSFKMFLRNVVGLGIFSKMGRLKAMIGL